MSQTTKLANWSTWHYFTHQQCLATFIYNLMTSQWIAKFIRILCTSTSYANTWNVMSNFLYRFSPWRFLRPVVSWKSIYIENKNNTQITSLTTVYSSVYSDADQRKHQSSASLAFVREIHRGPVNSPHKWPVTRKMFPFDDVIMNLVHLLEIADVLIFNCRVIWLSENSMALIQGPIVYGKMPKGWLNRGRYR